MSVLSLGSRREHACVRGRRRKANISPNEQADYFVQCSLLWPANVSTCFTCTVPFSMGFLWRRFTFSAQETSQFVFIGCERSRLSRDSEDCSLSRKVSTVTWQRLETHSRVIDGPVHADDRYFHSQTSSTRAIVDFWETFIDRAD